MRWAVYATNMIESVYARLRKILETREQLPIDDSRDPPREPVARLAYRGGRSSQATPAAVDKPRSGLTTKKTGQPLVSVDEKRLVRSFGGGAFFLQKARP